MRARLKVCLVALCSLVSMVTPSEALSSVTAKDYAKLTRVVRQDFNAIDVLRTVVMAEDQFGRFDIVVIGISSKKYGGWRAEIYAFEKHRLKKVWDSVTSASETEFGSSGPTNMSIRVRDYDYDLLISGCVPRNCGGGIKGYLLFNGASRRTFKAKLTTEETDLADETYAVSFSNAITADAKKILMGQICLDAMLNKKGLPFSCATAASE